MLGRFGEMRVGRIHLRLEAFHGNRGLLRSDFSLGIGSLGFGSGDLFGTGGLGGGSLGSGDTTLLVLRRSSLDSGLGLSASLGSRCLDLGANLAILGLDGDLATLCLSSLALDRLGLGSLGLRFLGFDGRLGLGGRGFANGLRGFFRRLN